MFNRNSLLAAACVATLAMLAAASANAWAPNRNYLTFKTSVALPGVTLGPGTYTFERPLDMSSDAVQVSSRDRSKVYFTGLTTPIDRPHGQRADQLVTLAEASAGKAPQVVAWFPVGESRGHRFVY